METSLRLLGQGTRMHADTIRISLAYQQDIPMVDSGRAERIV